MELPGITPDDEFTLLTDADFMRVDLVGKGANGIPRFIIAKQGGESAGLLDPEFVRDLITKAPQEASVPEPSEAGQTTLPNGIVIKGSPADMAAFFSAARNPGDNEKRPTPADVAATLAKADMSTKSANDLPDSDFAYIESGGEKDADGKTTPRSLRHFPLNDAAHVRNALSRAPQSPFGDKAMPKIKAAAKKLGIDVAKEADVAQAVAKDMMDAAGDSVPLDDGMDGMDPTVPLAAPDDETDMPGDPTDPGSPAWEAIDAATAQKWAGILSRAKNALCMLAEREMLEAASADPSDAENAFNLEDAAMAIDYAIGNLAVFAAGEQAEAEIGAEMADMCKALAAFDPAGLGVVEGLTAVAKAGRVLSSANESAIRAAAESLQKVLASLPEAPIAKEKGAEMPINTIDMRGREMAQGSAAETLAKPGPVAKGASAEEQARNAGPVNAGGTTGMGQPRTTGPDAALPGDGPQAAMPGDTGRQVVKSALQVAVYDASRRFAGLVSPDSIVQQVAKADDAAEGKPAMQAVFDENGNLVGIVDPADITPVAGASSKADDPAPEMAADAPAGDDMTPQPPADAGIAADAVGKAAEENVTTVTQEVLKSIAEQAARTALEAQGATHQEVVAKMAADNGELAEELKVVKARLAVVEEHPAAPGVFTNGAVPPRDSRPLPPAGQLRGQDMGGDPSQIDVAKAMVRKGELYRAPDAATQNEIAKSMQGDAILALQAIHSGRPVPAQA